MRLLQSAVELNRVRYTVWVCVCVCVCVRVCECVGGCVGVCVWVGGWVCVDISLVSVKDLFLYYTTTCKTALVKGHYSSIRLLHKKLSS